MYRNALDKKIAKLEKLTTFICKVCNERGNPPHLNRVIGDLLDLHTETFKQEFGHVL